MGAIYSDNPIADVINFLKQRKAAKKNVEELRAAFNAPGEWRLKAEDTDALH